jgi:hypothetical protein
MTPFRKKKKPKWRWRNRPELSGPQILAWADAHRARTASWPNRDSGVIPEAWGETWSAVDSALRQGTRGLPGGSSLAQLLKTGRGVRNLKQLPPLTAQQVAAWARAHRQRTGQWPHVRSGRVRGSNGENWGSINNLLRFGGRGLAGGSSLSSFLARHCGHRNPKDLPPLSEAQIWKWAQAHRRRTGGWPRVKSGPVPEAPGETWNGIDRALTRGRRGMPGGSSLYQFLQKHRLQNGERDQP